MKYIPLLTIPFLTWGMVSCTQNESNASDSGITFVKKENSNPAIVAKFNGKDITSEDLEKASPEVFEARINVYQAQKRAVEEYVRNLILEDLAKKANLSMDEFMKKEMETAKKKVSAKDIEAFLKKNNVPDVSKVPEHIKDQVRGLLHVQSLVTSATKGNQVELYLKRPKSTSNVEFKKDGSPSWGDEKAPVTIVEFSDFQCPYCASGKNILNDLKKTYGKKIHVVFKHFPLPMHPEARPAAEASMCVYEQNADKFWKYHDMLFENQSKLSEKDLKDYAKNVGADEKKFDECVKAKKYAAMVDGVMEEARQLGVNSTPTFYVNGQPIHGARAADIREIIDEAIGK